MDRSARAVFDRAQGIKIFGVNTEKWLQRTADYSDRIQALTATGQFPRILLAQADPIEFMAGFMAACRAECPVFLGNPAWSSQEWQQVLQIAQPHQVWGTLPPSLEWQPPTMIHSGERGWIMIATGGSSGKLKFAIHTWQTLTAAVDGFQSFFATPAIDSCCVLPLYHVSGLMQFMRSLLTGGKLIVLPFAELVQGQSRDSYWDGFLAAESAIPQTFYLSLVPTQLQRLLQHPQRVAWLQRFRTILLGGAAPWPQLLEQARNTKLNLAFVYGMTETAALVAVQPASAWHSSGHPALTILSHASVQILDPTGQPNPLGQPGQVKLRATSLFQGYYPHAIDAQEWQTDDIGVLDADHHLTLIGRNSRKIVSGGENIFPEEVEAALQATGLVKDVYVLGLPDTEWGEAVVALYVPSGPNPTPQDLKSALEPWLSRYKHPKHWICVADLPRNGQHKLDQQQIKQLALQKMAPYNQSQP